MREDLPGDKRLVAYIVGTRQYPPLAVSDLRRHLQERLPEYMVPSALLLLESLPLNANGKVDRLLLPAPEGLRPEIETNYQVPQTPMEHVIAAAWQEVLQLKQVGIHDNFFDLGGHSLLMVQLQSKLREALQMDLAIVGMFQYPTIHTLASYLSQKQGDLPRLQQSDTRVEKLREGKNRLKRVRERTPHGSQGSKESQMGTFDETSEQRNGIEIAIIGMAGRFPELETLKSSGTIYRVAFVLSPRSPTRVPFHQGYPPLNCMILIT